MRVLVTGATGNVGRIVVEQLVAAGVRVRAMTRTPERARFAEAVETVAGHHLPSPGGAGGGGVQSRVDTRAAG